MKSVGDDLSWSHGKHAFKLGIEWRRQESNGFNDPNYDPVTTLGSPNALALTGLTSTQYPGLNATPATLARNILYDLTGSVAHQPGVWCCELLGHEVAEHPGHSEQPALELPE